MKKLLWSLGLAAALLLGPAAPAARAWGIVGHRAVTQLAVYELPADLQAFYYRHMAEIVRLSNSPDERRATDRAEAKRHLFLIDHYSQTNPFAKVPRDYDGAVEKYSADTLKHYGTLPWVIQDVRTRLAAAWTSRDTTEVIHLSAELSNYAADAFVPLRTTVNFDGQLSNQTGMLSLWETQLPEKFLATYQLSGEPARTLKDPLADTWLVLQNSYGLLSAAFDLESKVSKRFTPQTKYTFAHRFGRTQRRYSDAFVAAYNEEVGAIVTSRLRSSATFVASLWLTAWQEAGRPTPAQLMTPAKLTADEKTKLADDLKGFKANTLTTDQLLLAQQKQQKVQAADDIKAAEGEMAAPPAPEPDAAPAPTPPAGTPAAKPTPDKVKVKVKAPAAPPAKQKAKPASDGWN